MSDAHANRWGDLVDSARNSDTLLGMGRESTELRKQLQDRLEILGFVSRNSEPAPLNWKEVIDSKLYGPDGRVATGRLSFMISRSEDLSTTGFGDPLNAIILNPQLLLGKARIETIEYAGQNPRGFIGDTTTLRREVDQTVIEYLNTDRFLIEILAEHTSVILSKGSIFSEQLDALSQLFKGNYKALKQILDSQNHSFGTITGLIYRTISEPLVVPDISDVRDSIDFYAFLAKHESRSIYQIGRDQMDRIVRTYHDNESLEEFITALDGLDVIQIRFVEESLGRVRKAVRNNL